MESLIREKSFAMVPDNVLLPRYFKALKAGIWLYFFLLVFEGALRKWVLPGLATPLLLIRDPLAVWLILVSWRHRLLNANPYLQGLVLIGIVSTFTALFLGHKNLGVALFGARVFLLHLPLIFVIGKVFDHKDVEKLGKTILWISIPMAVLTAIQFYSPQSAFVNRGVGGDMEGAGFGGALGYFRPPGTFSFTNGNTLFFSLVACYIFYFWLKPDRVKPVLLIISSVALLVSIPISISRTLLFQVVVCGLFFIVVALMVPKNKGKLVWIASLLVIGLPVLSQTSFFNTATEVFTSRFEDANAVEGGLEGVVGNRFFGTLLNAVTDAFENPLFGYGLGVSSNVGIMLLPGNKGAGVSDFEWERLIVELGPLLGLAVVFIRVALIFKIGVSAFRCLRHQMLLPWMLLSFGSLTLLQAQWAQPTSLGFCTLIGGLMVASFHTSDNLDDAE